MRILKIFTTLFFLLTVFTLPIPKTMAEEAEDASIQIEEVQEEEIGVEKESGIQEESKKEEKEEKSLQETLQTKPTARYSWGTILLAILIPSIFVILIYLIFKFFKF